MPRGSEGSDGEDVTEVRFETSATAQTEIQFLSINVTENFRLPPGKEKVTVSDSFSDLDLLGHFLLFGIGPHMHTLGQTLQVSAIDGEAERCLLNVDRWDFHRQQAYFYKRPISFPASPHREIELECSFDTSESSEPVTYGMNTENEMCQALLIYPREPIQSADSALE